MSDNEQKIKITLRADWGIGPFWVSIGDGGPDGYEANEITEIVPLSDDLLSAVTAWDEWFQSTFNDATPQDSGIRDPVERDRFVEEGRMLAQRIKREVPPGVVVEYGTAEGEALAVE